MWYQTKRNRWMPYPERPEGTRLLFYNIHFPGKDGRPGTPVGVVALLVSDDLKEIARGVTIRSLLDDWDPGEGRIRAAGRAIRAYMRYYHGDDTDLSVVATFDHPHAMRATVMHSLGAVKFSAPAVPTAKEFRLLEKKFGNRVRAEHGVHA